MATVMAPKKPKPPFYAGFDLGGTKMLSAVYDSRFRQLGRSRTSTNGQQGAERVIQRMLSTLADALAKAGLDSSDLAAVGIGVPGPVNMTNGVVHTSLNLGWQDVPLVKILQQQLDRPLWLLNDVDAGVFGEFEHGAARGAHCVIGVFPGTGIGGGAVYDGQVISGRGQSAMEIGHIQVINGGPLCTCGRHGCLETVASRLAISSQAAAMAYRGKAPYLYEQIGTEVALIRSGMLARSIKHGDKAIEGIVREAARFLGKGIAQAVMMMLPDIIVLGGGLVEAMPDLFVEEVEKSARSHVLPEFHSSFCVKPAALGDDASVLGAASWAARQLSAEHKT